MFSLRRHLLDLEKAGHVVRLEEEIDPRLEAAELHLRQPRFPLLDLLRGARERADEPRPGVHPADIQAAQAGLIERMGRAKSGAGSG